MAVLAVEASTAPGVFETNIPAQTVRDKQVGDHESKSTLGSYLDWRRLLRRSGRNRHHYVR